MSVPITFSLGRVTIAIAGDTPLAEAVACDLDVPAADVAGEVALEMAFPPVGSPLPGRRLEGTRMLRATFGREDGHPVVYVQSGLPDHLSRLPDPLFRFLHPSYITRAGYGAQLVAYQLLYGAAQLVGLHAGQSFLHASAVEREDRRVAVVGRGGIGKTGSLLRLVSSRQWRYLSDDWTLVESSGVIHHSPKPLQVHPRNLTHLPDGEALLLAGRTTGDRLSWWLRKRVGVVKGMRRSATAEALFGHDHIGSPGPLSEVLLVRRSDVDSIVEMHADPSELTKEAAATVMKELRPSLLLLRPHLVDLTDGAWTSIEHAHAATADVLAQAFSNCELFEIRVPNGLREPEIERFLVDRLSD